VDSSLDTGYNWGSSEMKYNKHYGIYTFQGNEDDIVFIHWWDCACDLSFKGFIETVYRMITHKPPKRYQEIMEAENGR